MSLVKPVKSAEDKPERSSDEALTTMANVEGEIREFVRRDVVSARRTDVDLGAGNINFQIERVAGSSIKEIDNLIADLETVREFLRSEGERVAREITSYAQASQAAMSSAKVVSDSMTQWKSAVGAMKAEQHR
jgi:prefoldin subunit 5